MSRFNDLRIRLLYHISFGKKKEHYKKKWKDIKHSRKNCKTDHVERAFPFSDVYKNYCQFLEERNFNRTKEFTKITEYPFDRRKNDTKVIAYYLPQYYHIDVNDRFHGKGFTEWTKATQAIPLFTGHNQPHLPYDLGFYNLLDIETIKRQVELAKMYGIYGFCIHWYWFSGVRTMEKPLELLLKHPEIDINYCLNWATENWTALWDGGNNEMIFEQKLNEDDDYKLFCDLLPYFKDPRYIKINNRPVFSIYNVSIFEKKRLTLLISNLRKYAEEAGLEGLYINLTNSGHFFGDVEEYGADALQEFSPSCLSVERYELNGYINPKFCGAVIDYPDISNKKKYFIEYASKKYYRSVLVGFDNSARKACSPNCVIFHGNSPLLFKNWLTDVLIESKKIHTPDEDIVFINNWNEWAEGSHLEPDLRYGYANLQAVKEALEEVRPLDTTIIQEKISKIHKGSIIHFYVHCIESFGDIVACEPISRWLKKQSQKCKIHWIVKSQYKDLVKFNPYIDELIEVDGLTSAIDICDKKREESTNIIIDCHYDKRWDVKTGRVHHNPNNPIVNENTYFNYGSILETFCLSAGLPPINDAPVFWEDKSINLKISLPNNYIVFHCKSAEKIKDWSDENWNSLATSLIDRGYNIVEIGLQKTINLKNKKYIDLTALSKFQELAQVIKSASAFCGVDSGFAHVANCYKVPSCILIGKYKSFDFPMPYTGYFAKNKENILFANGKPALEIAQENVLARLEEIMKGPHSSLERKGKLT